MTIFFGAGLALALALAVILFLLLLRERRARKSVEAALAASRGEMADQSVRLELLDRRSAVIAPIEALWLAWASGRMPGDALFADAARALAGGRLLFADHLQAELDWTASLIVEHVRGHASQRAAIEAGRFGQRAELIAEEIERERRLKPMIGHLRTRLADATRLP